MHMVGAVVAYTSQKHPVQRNRNYGLKNTHQYGFQNGERQYLLDQERMPSKVQVNFCNHAKEA